NILVKEFVELYNSYSRGATPALRPLPVQYRDYAVWQRRYISGDYLEEQLGYWEEKLRDAATLELPTDFVRRSVQEVAGAAISFTIAPELTAGLRALCQREGVTLYMLLLAGFNVLLHRYSGQQDIVVGTPVAGRTQEQLSELIGFFVNTLAIRSTVEGDPSFQSLLAQVKASTLEAYDHQQAPFEKVVERVVKQRDTSRSPLFQVLFALQNTEEKGTPAMALDGLTLSEYGRTLSTTQFDLHLIATETEEGVSFLLRYSTALFGRQRMERMGAHYSTLLHAIVNDPGQRIGDLDILTTAERHQLLEGFNATAAEYPRDKTIVQLFEEQVDRTPEATAVVFEDQALSYRQLDERANQLAHLLLAKGSGPSDRIGLFSRRSIEMITAMLGILKSGGIYVPFNLEYPPDRLTYIREDAGISMIVTTGAALPDLPATGDCQSVFIQEALAYPLDRPVLTRDSQTGVYIMYTSGTTGKPKGILVNQGNILKLVYEPGEIAVRPGDRMLQWSNYAFDGSVYEIYSCLLMGARLCLIKDSAAADVYEIAATIRQQEVTMCFITTALFNTFIDHHPAAFSKVRKLLFGGENVSVPHVRKAIDILGSDKIIHVYGPTETTVYATYYPITKVMDNDIIPIGRPLANTQITIRDRNGKIVPVGVDGEIYIGGAGVATGYVGKDSLTKERFVSFDGENRWYKTGDQGRWSPDGNVEFLGRKDHQVKIRGYRIELGEIETVLQQAPGVQQAIVAVSDEKASGKRLTGYVVTAGKLDRDAVSAFLSSKLPDYMIPASLVEMDNFPLTPNGKVDRKALPDPDLSGSSGKEYVTPQTRVEEQLAEIWMELLEVERVGIQDNFFELGGHSLLAVQFISAVRQQLAKELSIKDIFENPTIASLAQRWVVPAAGVVVPSGEVGLPPVRRRERSNKAPLSFAQERLWFIDRLQGSVQYNMPWLFRLTGPLDKAALADAFRQVITRHEILRTVIREEGGIGYQQSLPAGGWKMEEVAPEGGIDWHSLVHRRIEKRFNLAQDYLLKVTLIELSAREHLLLMLTHHIAFDGWSIGLVVAELVELYKAKKEDRKPVLKELPLQYA
ncbi:amino acid adenylation domain-containing protein, partial [Puia sp.]|uniref:non-ribosomal peptide synthetase n=1 Tax=Puia sp. TaxID=2045100 RepID=UPI002F3F429B